MSSRFISTVILVNQDLPSVPIKAHGGHSASVLQDPFCAALSPLVYAVFFSSPPPSSPAGAVLVLQEHVGLEQHLL